MRCSVPQLPYKRAKPAQFESSDVSAVKIAKVSNPTPVQCFRENFNTSRLLQPITSQAGNSLKEQADSILAQKPASERYSDLLQPQLPLPEKYSSLLRVFKCLDSALSIHTYRKTRALFDEVQHAIAINR